ncbi:MAG: FAD-dependent oxidoreductase, partial [Candidatus Hydrothermarchaeota archaeon]
MDYDIVIIGAGPAGLFAAHELSRRSKLKTLIVELGKSVEERRCPMEKIGYCSKCDPCNILSGVGGSGGLSDGTLNIRPDIGGNLYEFMG